MYGQMNEPPGARARVALTGLTVAEYFRDEEGQDVLLFIDNIFRFTQAGSEVSVQSDGGGKEGVCGMMCCHLPSLQGVGVAGPHPICRWLPAHPGN